MGKSTWEIFWMPDKERQRPSGWGEEGQGAKGSHGKDQLSGGRQVFPAACAGPAPTLLFLS